jgi:3-hydroxyisobutyrate dehydrogenase/2-hydroxy-3-oxopropionate reductase
MAQRLIGAGHRGTVWNRTPARAAPLAASRATVTTEPAHSCASADVFNTMVRHGEAPADVVGRPNGIAARIRPDTAFIDMSTVGPAALSRLTEAMPRGVEILDAPVLGTLDEAERGNLTILVGGAESAVDRARPVLSAMGAVVHVGASRTAAAGKLLANSALFAVLGAVGESIALGRRLGLTEEQTFAVLSRSALGERALRWRDSMAQGEFPSRFALALAGKDADLALEAAGAGGMGLPILQAARSWLARAERAGRGASDYTAVLAEIADPAAPDQPTGCRFSSRRLVAPRSWAEGCRAWDLIDRPDRPVSEESMAPGAAERWHVHTWAHQLVYVLGGTLTVRTPAGETSLRAGDAFEIDPGVPHQVANTSARDVRFLIVAQPSSSDDRRDLTTPIVGHDATVTR